MFLITITTPCHYHLGLICGTRDETMKKMIIGAHIIGTNAQDCGEYHKHIIYRAASLQDTVQDTAQGAK